MKTVLCVTALAAVLCGGMSACLTAPSASDHLVPFGCVVQPESEVIYELQLDGKLVTMNKAAPKQQHLDKLAAAPGDHVLTVTAPGHATWQRTITLAGGTESGPTFWVVLKPSAKEP